MRIKVCDAERAVYLQQNGWNWGFGTPVSTRPRRKLFSRVDDQLLKPTIKVYRG